MANGYQKNQNHKDAVALLGKTLIRRSNKKCELCETSGVSLSVMEVEPAPSVPDPDHAIMVCDSCRYVLESGKFDPNALRFLESVIWSETTVVQVTAVRLCQKLADKGVDWSKQLLDTVYLSPETEAWLNNN